MILRNKVSYRNPLLGLRRGLRGIFCWLMVDEYFGSKTHIRRGIFGSVENYQQAIKDLENALYASDAS